MKKKEEDNNFNIGSGASYLKEDEKELDTIKLTVNTPAQEVINLSKDCGKCGHCCSKTSGFVLKEELGTIANFLNIREEELVHNCMQSVEIYNKKIWRPHLIKKGKPYGMCIFFNADEGCTIQEVKPLHCRISGCHELAEQTNVWYMLNHIIDHDDPEAIRQYAQYLDAHATIPGGRLKDIVPNESRLKKILNHEIR